MVFLVVSFLAMNPTAFQDFPTLTTKRLRLSELGGDQLDALAEIAAYKVPNATAEDALQLLERSRQQYKTKEGITWGLYFEGELIGSCGYYRGFKDDSGEIGYMMRADFRKRGFMKEALEKVIEFGFQSFELSRVTAYTAEENLPSVQMLLQAGFKDSGMKHKELTIFERLKNQANP